MYEYKEKTQLRTLYEPRSVHVYKIVTVPYSHTEVFKLHVYDNETFRIENL